MISPEIILNAYLQGYFPMAEGDSSEIYWHSPNPRAIIPLDNPKMPKSLRKSIRKNGYSFTIDENFEFVIRACAEREETWISEEIIENYCELNSWGVAHSIETWVGDDIVGGLYGISLGSAFFGESMFNLKSDAAKGAFFFLIEYLQGKDFTLLDSQYINHFTEQLGAVEISKKDYYKLLKVALAVKNKF